MELELDMEGELDMGAEIVRKTSKRFSPENTAILCSLYSSGMRGVGKKYTVFIERAVAETGLSTEQVMVYMILDH